MATTQQHQATWPQHSNSNRPHGHNTPTAAGHMATTQQQQQATWPRQPLFNPHVHKVSKSNVTLRMETLTCFSPSLILLLSFTHPASNEGELIQTTGNNGLLRCSRDIIQGSEATKYPTPVRLRERLQVKQYITKRLQWEEQRTTCGNFRISERNQIAEAQSTSGL